MGLNTLRDKTLRSVCLYGILFIMNRRVLCLSRRLRKQNVSVVYMLLFEENTVIRIERYIFYDICKISFFHRV